MKLNKTTISFYIKYCPISQTNSISVAAPVIDVPRESNVPKKENNFLRPSRSTAGSRRSDDESCVQLGGDDFLYRLVMEENYDPLIKSNITKLDKALLDINRLRKETMPKKNAASSEKKSNSTIPMKKSTRLSVAYSAPIDSHNQERSNWLNLSKKLGDLVKTIAPLLQAQKQDEEKTAKNFVAIISAIKSLTSMNLKIDVAQDCDDSDSITDSRVPAVLRKKLPTWLVDVAKDVVKYDIGLRLVRLEFKYSFQKINSELRVELLALLIYTNAGVTFKLFPVSYL